MQLPPVAVTTVGSFPRPAWLAERQRTEVRFLLEGEALRQGVDDATRVVLQEQAELGIDLLTDGEQRRLHFIEYLLGNLDGFDLVDRRPKAIRRRKTGEWKVPRVVGKVGWRAPLMVDDLRFVKAHSSGPVKLALPGPMTIVDSTYDDAYGDEAALALDAAAALNRELLALQEAGCDVVQIDEPAMTRYHEKVAAYGARALDRCLEGVTIPSIVHLCYGYPGTGPQQHGEFQYPDLLPMLMETRIGGFSVEFARSGYDPALLASCRDRVIMYGCIDPGPGPAEPLETVLARVRAVLPHVDPARLWLAPDCGLMIASREEARDKVRCLIDAAQAVRREL